MINRLSSKDIPINHNQVPQVHLRPCTVRTKNFKGKKILSF